MKLVGFNTLFFIPGWGFHASCFDGLLSYLDPAVKPRDDERKKKPHNVSLQQQPSSRGLNAGSSRTKTFSDKNEINLDQFIQRSVNQIPENAHLIGWSLGGLIARKILEIRNDLTATCFGHHPNWLSGGALNLPSIYALKKRQLKSPDKNLKAFIRWQAGEMTAFKRCHPHVNWDAQAEHLDWLLSESCGDERITTVLGTEDRLVSMPKNFNGIVIPNAGHSLPITHPKECAQIILEQIKRHEPCTQS